MDKAQTAKSPVGAGQIAVETTSSVSVDGDGDFCNVITARTIAAMQLRGFSVHRTGEGFAVCRWNLSRHCPDLRTLVQFARQAGATA